MTEQKDEIRLKQLLSIFGEDRQKEIIEILHRDQIRYHQEQLILSGVVNQRELLLDKMDKYLMLNTNLDAKDLLDFKERFKQ